MKQTELKKKRELKRNTRFVLITYDIFQHAPTTVLIQTHSSRNYGAYWSISEHATRTYNVSEKYP